MKKILDACCLAIFALGIFGACSDVPAPYDIIVDNNDEDSLSVVLSETFAESLGDFSEKSVKGSNKWTWKGYNDGGYAYMTGYSNGSNLENEDWLISPEINLIGKKAILSFDQAIYAGKNHDAIDEKYMIENQKVMITSNYTGDPATTDWDTLKISEYPGGKSWAFVTSTASIPEKFINKGNKIRFAFKYTSDDNDSAGWEVKNVTLMGEGTSEGGNSEGGNSEGGNSEGGNEGGNNEEGKPSGEAILSETFANGFGTFTIQNIIGNEEWTADTSYNYVKMSAYSGGTTNENEDWLISPTIDLSNVAILSFEQVFGPANISLDNASTLYTVWASSDYIDDVTTANWIQIPITYPGQSGWKPFVTVSVELPTIASNARIAFKYKNAATDNTATWEIKNLTIKVK